MVVGIWRFSWMDFRSWVFLFCRSISVFHSFPEIWIAPVPQVHHGCDAHVQTDSVITGLPPRVSLQASHGDEGSCCVWVFIAGAGGVSFPIQDFLNETRMVASDIVSASTAKTSYVTAEIFSILDKIHTVVRWGSSHMLLVLLLTHVGVKIVKKLLGFFKAIGYCI